MEEDHPLGGALRGCTYNVGGFGSQCGNSPIVWEEIFTDSDGFRSRRCAEHSPVDDPFCLHPLLWSCLIWEAR